MDHGHTEAQSYPVGMVWAEVPIVLRRINRDYATTGTILQAAISASFSKKAAREFKKMISKLQQSEPDE